MQASIQVSKQERVHGPHKPKGNWMQLTIAPWVAEKLDREEPLPGAGNEHEPLRSFVGAARRAGLADDDLA